MNKRLITAVICSNILGISSIFAQNSFPPVGDVSINDGTGNKITIAPENIILENDDEQTAVISNSGNATFNGLLIAHEIEVKQNVWADHVFTDEYRLKPIDYLSDYIKTNKHLPGIPSEKEVSINGINIAMMNALLLQKIEELTLYIIELNNRIVLLEKELND